MEGSGTRSRVIPDTTNNSSGNRSRVLPKLSSIKGKMADIAPSAEDAKAVAYRARDALKDSDAAGVAKSTYTATRDQTKDVLRQTGAAVSSNLTDSSVRAVNALANRFTGFVNKYIGPSTSGSGEHYTYGGSESSLSGLLFLAIVIVLVLMIVYLMYKAAPTIVKRVKSLL
jgi:hypothetical protein